MEKLRYRECQTGRRFIIQLEPGTRIAAALIEFAKSQKIAFASLVSAVGSVRQIEFTDIQVGAQLPMSGPRTKVHKLDGPLELLGLEGNLVPNAAKEMGAQLYILGSKSSGEVVGGRLVDAEVFATCEIVLAEYTVDGVERHYSPESGVDTLFIDHA